MGYRIRPRRCIVALILPHYGWRGVFFAGLLPALFVFWIRRRVAEPERWTAIAKTAAGRTSITQIFRGSNARHLTIVTAVNAATLFAWWGLFFWVPSYLSLPVSQGGRGLSIVQTSTWTILMQAGTFLGYISYGFLADLLGRKWVYVGFLFMAAIVVQFYAHAASAIALLWIGPHRRFLGNRLFQRLRRHHQRTLPYRDTRHRHGLRLQHRQNRQRRRTAPHRQSIRPARHRLCPRHHVLQLSLSSFSRHRHPRNPRQAARIAIILLAKLIYLCESPGIGIYCCLAAATHSLTDIRSRASCSFWGQSHNLRG